MHSIISFPYCAHRSQGNKQEELSKSSDDEMDSEATERSWIKRKEKAAVRMESSDFNPFSLSTSLTSSTRSGVHKELYKMWKHAMDEMEAKRKKGGIIETELIEYCRSLEQHIKRQIA